MIMLEVQIKTNDKTGAYAFFNAVDDKQVSTCSFNRYDLVFMYHKGINKYKIIKNKNGPANIWVIPAVFEEFALFIDDFDNISETDFYLAGEALKRAKVY